MGAPQSEDVPPEHKAIALHNRGVKYGERGEPAKAIADYDVVIRTPGATAQRQAQSLVNRVGALRQRGKPEKAIVDFTAVIDMSTAR